MGVLLGQVPSLVLEMPSVGFKNTELSTLCPVSGVASGT